MAMRLTNAAASAAADSTGLRGYISTTPKLKFYAGNVHASAETAPAGTLLATVTVGNFGAASNGVITSTGGSVAAVASDTVGCWALFKSDGTTKVSDGNVHATVGGGGDGLGDINFDIIIWVAGGTASVGTFTLTVPPA
jgi:hypothetical protein